MDKFIPYEKRSKKAKREADKKQRRDWGGLNPVTRKPEDSCVYNRNKMKDAYRKGKFGKDTD